MYEANSTEFKPAEGEMPNTIQRFNLDEVKGQIKEYSDSIQDSIKIMLNGAFVIGIGVGVVVMFSSESSKEEQQKKLEKQSEHVNMAVTTIDRTDIDDINKAIDLAYLAETRAASYVKMDTKMGKSERKLRKLVPQVDVMNPDEESPKSTPH
jgi:uncharacterized membrane-anchored protein YhcB (DUF1043 family)